MPGANLGTPPTGGSGTAPGTLPTPGSATQPNMQAYETGTARMMPYDPNMHYGNQQGMPQFYNQNMPCNHQFPNMTYPTYQGVPNMYLPNVNPYGTPMGIPMYPLYGYDNSEELDRDVEYMKLLYPSTAKVIQKEVDDECDQMEYDGSVMFDEYPDRNTIDKIVDRIYEKVKDTDEEPEVQANSVFFFPPRRHRNDLRDIVSLLLLNELFHRRRRHRSRKRWF
jgi:hypothetical protein